MIWILIAVVAATILLFVIGPWMLSLVIKSRINRILSRGGGLTGSLAGVHMDIAASKINFTNIEVAGKSGNHSFQIHIPRAALAYQWKSIFKKRKEVRLTIYHPQAQLKHSILAGENDASLVNKSSSAIRDSIATAMPFRVDTQIIDGGVIYSKDTEPTLDLSLTCMNISVVNFSNDSQNTTPCNISMSATIAEGTLILTANLYPLEPSLTLDAHFELRAINLVPFNNVLREMAKVDVNSGWLAMNGEAAIIEDHFKGYVTPIFSKLDFIGKEDRNDGILRKIWERLLTFTAHALENKKGELATTIPFEGSLHNGKVNLMAAIAGLFRNAFMKPKRI